MTPIATVDDLIQALLEAQDATTPVTLTLTSAEYDLSSSTFEPDERFGYEHMQCALPYITKNITIDIDSNPALQSVKIYQENPMFRHLYVAQGASLNLNHLELAYGDVGSYDTGGGAIYNDGTLTVRNCVFHDNKSNYGGAIVNTHGHTDIFNCDFFDNEADWGGALYNASVASGCVMTVTDSRIANNKSLQSWGVGGGITNFGTLTMTHCMIRGNEAVSGGGIANWAADAQINIQYSHIRLNTGYNYGGGLVNQAGSLNVNCSTVVDNISPNGSEAYRNGGVFLMDKVSLPNSYSSSQVPAGVGVTNVRPYWKPEFVMERQVSTKKLVPTYLYDTDQRKQLSKFAVQASRNNFDGFATSLTGNVLGTGTEQTTDHDTSSVGGRIKYSFANVLRHRSYTDPLQNKTGSSIFVSEMLYLGGAIPMVKSTDGTASCPGSLSPAVDNGWRACIDQNGRADNTTEVWKNHNQIVNYFAAIGNDYDEEIQDYTAATVTFTDFNGDNMLNMTANAGTLNLSVGNLADFREKMYAIFQRSDLEDIQTGDYIFLNLGQDSVTHGLLIVGWGPAVECPQGLNSLEVGFANPTHTQGEYQVMRKAGTVPYVVDLAYSYNEGEDKTGWLEDPRPRPFYCTAVIIAPSNTVQMDPVLSRLGSFATLASYLEKLRNQYQRFPTQSNQNPDWRFVHIPKKLPATNGVLLTCV